MPIELPPVELLNTMNGTVQVSAAQGDSSIGLLVERDGLFGGTLLTLTQAKELARVLLRRARLG